MCGPAAPHFATRGSACSTDFASSAIRFHPIRTCSRRGVFYGWCRSRAPRDASRPGGRVFAYPAWGSSQSPVRGGLQPLSDNHLQARTLTLKPYCFPKLGNTTEQVNMLTVQMRQQASDHRSRDATPAKSGLRPHINYIGVAHAIGQDPRRADDPRAGVGEAVEEAILRGLASQAPEILRISCPRIWQALSETAHQLFGAYHPLICGPDHPFRFNSKLLEL